jgi:hypothetical protein
VQTSQFIELASGKEELVTGSPTMLTTKTVSYLKVDSAVNVKHEINSVGQIVKRSMGDLWVHSNGMYNPINIKSGITLNGNPNVVSLAKLVDRPL